MCLTAGERFHAKVSLKDPTYPSAATISPQNVALRTHDDHDKSIFHT